jgi:serine/threonine-protein kinase
MDSLAPPVIQPGSRLGSHELVRWLGEGGFAEVWLGKRSDAPSDLVAIKVVRRGRARDPKLRAMFLDEAALASRIVHPNVARVLATGEEAGLLYLVMEHVSGGSLDAVMAGAEALGEPFPVAVGVRILADTCAGLHAAHELTIDGRPQHVIHRDVSPQNILVTEAGVPKLIDFGVAKARERLSRETSTGITKGKIAYMSPEQARAEDLDRRSDIWSIGAVAFELLEGRPLLEGATEIARLTALVGGAVRPTFTRVPERIAAVIRRALSLDPRDRHATADDLRLELERALAREGLEASAEDVAAFCAKARAAAAARSAAEADTAPAPRLAELLGAPDAAVTTSDIHPVAGSARGAPRRRYTGWIAAAVIAPVLAAAAIVRFGGARSPAAEPARAVPAAPEITASALPPPPLPAVSSAAVDPPAPAPPASASAVPAAARAPATTPAGRPRAGRAPGPAAKPRDDDQIE